MRIENRLPPGQQAIAEFPRFGSPQFAGPLEVPAQPVISIRGDVEGLLEIALEELTVLPRQEQTSDLHCVATWSRLGLHWSGYRFADFYEQILVPRASPWAGAAFLLFRGLDGFWASLSVDDALAREVMLADRLEGEPLSIEHGAPIRLVAPAHYGYKSIKHLISIEFRGTLTADAMRQMHPRARVAREERVRFLPGWLVRPVFRAGLPRLRRKVEQAYKLRDRSNGKSRPRHL